MVGGRFTVGSVSALSGNRAAVFTHQSQHCEVHVEGAWWPGSLRGWRHDGQGACQVWVLVTVAGVDRETWTDLAEVRLPETRSAPVLVPDSATDPFASIGEELLPGASQGLDTICDGILGDGPFVLRDKAARPTALAG